MVDTAFRLIVRGLVPDKRTYHMPLKMINYGRFSAAVPYNPSTQTDDDLSQYGRFLSLTDEGKQFVFRSADLNLTFLEISPYMVIAHQQMSFPKQLELDQVIADICLDHLKEPVSIVRQYSEAVPEKIEIKLFSPTTMGKKHRFTIEEDLVNGPQRKKVNMLEPSVQRLVQGAFQFGVITLQIIDDRFVVEIPPSISLSYMETVLLKRFEGHNPEVFRG